MKVIEKSKLIQWTTLIAILVAMSGVATPLTDQVSANASTVRALMGITVTNNSSRTISHLYVSALNPEVWSADLISQPLTAGQSYTITDVSCSGNEIKVIAEDQQGCFSYIVLSCAQATTSWTVTNEAQFDCGN